MIQTLNDVLAKDKKQLSYSDAVTSALIFIAAGKICEILEEHLNMKNKGDYSKEGNLQFKAILARVKYQTYIREPVVVQLRKDALLLEAATAHQMLKLHQEETKIDK
jgi:hypothetical protein